jgi:hypothetical protein
MPGRSPKVPFLGRERYVFMFLCSKNGACGHPLLRIPGKGNNLKCRCYFCGKTVQSPSLIAEHFPGTVMDFTACSLPPPSAFTFDLLLKSDEVILFYFFIYLHMSESHLHVSKSLFIYLPLLQTTDHVPHPRTELLWRLFIKKDFTSHIYASITPHL